MPDPIYPEVIELLLSSMSKTVGSNGLRTSFFYGKPGEPLQNRRLGVEFFYDRTKLTLASLFVRQKGPVYLRYISVSDIWRMLQNFVMENYWYIANDTFIPGFPGSYAERVTPNSKRDFASALAASPIFTPRNELTLFPLSAVRVQADFRSEPLVFVAPSSLGDAVLPSEAESLELMPEVFPPYRDWKGERQKVGSWLGIRSPVYNASNKMKAAVLGALALAPLHRYRYSFSGRTVARGRCTFTETGLVSSFEVEQTPPIAHDIVLTAEDIGWLKLLSEMLSSPDKANRRGISALEYFYRAWPLDPPERFPILCMALDALLGDANQETNPVFDGVRNLVGPHVKEARLKHLLRIRGDVIHGRAPDVYDSDEYGKYYRKFGVDPIRDMELTVAACLRSKLFCGKLREHLDPNAEIIAQAQAAGRIPAKLSDNSILEDLD